MIFRWFKKFKLSEEEKSESTRAVEEATQILEVANQLHSEAKVAGANQRQLRADNHFGMKLAHIYRNG